MRGSPRRGVWLGLLLAALLIVTVAPVTQAGGGPKADLRIRRSGGELYGNGIYDMSGASQYVSMQIYAGDKRIVYISIQNDGPGADSYKVCECNALFFAGTIVRYFKDRSANEITDSVQKLVQSEAFTTPTQPGEKYVIRARVTVNDLTTPGELSWFRITATSDANNSVGDAVTIWVKRKVNVI
jgi:hypothetical protein